MGYIYVGPQFRDCVLRQYRYYKEIPDQYRDDPIYRNLFVAPDSLNEAGRQLARKGSRLRTFYDRAVKMHNKKEG